MDRQESFLAILGFIAFAIPIVGALWKLFSVREELQTKILGNQHRLDLLDQRIEHLVDQQKLFLNGIQERVQHTRDRSKHAEEALDLRLSDLEGFVEKTTAFNRRRSL
jgi:hypothetical protein